MHLLGPEKPKMFCVYQLFPFEIMTNIKLTCTVVKSLIYLNFPELQNLSVVLDICSFMLHSFQEPQLTACQPFDVYAKPFSLWNSSCPRSPLPPFDVFGFGFFVKRNLIGFYNMLCLFMIMWIAFRWKA